jgi:hypothetical protein
MQEQTRRLLLELADAVARMPDDEYHVDFVEGYKPDPSDPHRFAWCDPYFWGLYRRTKSALLAEGLQPLNDHIERQLIERGKAVERVMMNRGESGGPVLIAHNVIKHAMEDLAKVIRAAAPADTPAPEASTGAETRCLKPASWFSATTAGGISAKALYARASRGTLSVKGRQGRQNLYSVDEVISLYSGYESMIRDGMREEKEGINLIPKRRRKSSRSPTKPQSGS